MSTAVPTRSPASRTAKIVLGVLLILVPLAIALGGLLIPVRAEVMQPAPPGHQWIGVPPTVTVECGRLWDPQPPTWPDGVKYIRPGARQGAVEACEAAYPNQQLMTIVGGAFGVLLLVMIVWVSRRSRTWE